MAPALEVRHRLGKKTTAAAFAKAPTKEIVDLLSSDNEYDAIEYQLQACGKLKAPEHFLCFYCYYQIENEGVAKRIVCKVTAALAYPRQTNRP